MIMSFKFGLFPSDISPGSVILHPAKSTDINVGIVAINSTPASVMCSQ